MSELQALKALSSAREADERRLAERRKAALVLILRYLADHGYSDSYERLSSEANVSLNRVDVADNIDLLRVIQEFEEGYESRFGRRPRLIRRMVEEVAGGGGASRLKPLGHLPGPGPGSKHSPTGSSSGSTGAGAAPPARMPSPTHPCPGALSQPPPARPGFLDGPPVSGAMAARQRREAGAANAAVGAGAPGAAPGDAARREVLERRQAAMNSVKPPPEIGQQRIAGVSVGGGRSVVAGMSREEVATAQLAGLQVSGQNAAVAFASKAAGSDGEDDDPDAYFERRVLKPLPASLQGELRELGSAISRDIFTANPNVRWDDIAGLEQAKKLLKEAVVAPIKYPELFTGILAPWKGVLLYGPPGTGKTLLAKAVATECRTTFFNISASSIISKWRGDSEKLVRVLFDLARYHSPSTIFLDEIDALMGARGAEGEHEASRRMKTELLIQMDGIARGSELVFVLAATNLPWELDMALMRRLEKRILVPLPSLGARLAMFSSLLAGRLAAGVTPDTLAEKTEGYSGSDVLVVAKEAAMRPLRRLLIIMEGDGAGLSGAKAELAPISAEDVQAALTVSKPSARLHEAKYAKFSEEYGQNGV